MTLTFVAESTSPVWWINAVRSTHRHGQPVGFYKTQLSSSADTCFHQLFTFNGVLSKIRRKVVLHMNCDCDTQAGVVSRAAFYLSSVLVRKTGFWMSTYGHISAPVAQKIDIICCLAVYIAWYPIVAKAVAKAAKNSGRQV